MARLAITVLADRTLCALQAGVAEKSFGAHQAMGSIRKRLMYAWNACWSERDQIGRVVQLSVVTAPALLALLLQGWSKEAWSWWIWLGIVFFGILLAVLVGTLRRNYELESEREPRIECSSVEIWDNGGEQYIRVLIHNASLQELAALKARLEAITDSVDALAQGEVINGNGAHRRLDYPIQLFTKERLKERRQGGDKFARPFNLGFNEDRWIEVFQVTNPVVRSIHIYDAAYRHDLIAPDDMRFDCIVYGAGVPLTFAVEFAVSDDRCGYSVALLDKDSERIAEAKFDEES